MENKMRHKCRVEGKGRCGILSDLIFLNVSLKQPIKNGKNLGQTFTKGYANKHMKRCSASFSIRKMQIKATMGYHCTLIRKAKIKNDDNPKCW